MRVAFSGRRPRQDLGESRGRDARGKSGESPVLTRNCMRGPERVLASQSTRPDQDFFEPPRSGREGVARPAPVFGGRGRAARVAGCFDLGFLTAPAGESPDVVGAPIMSRPMSPDSMRPQRRGVPLFLPLFLCWSFAGAAVIGQTLEHSVFPTDFDPASSDKPFGLAFDPDGRTVYVALAGDLSFTSPQTANNDDVVRIDVLTGQQTAVGRSGLYPEEIAVAVDATGQARHVYVSNSTDGTVTCLTPDLSTRIADIELSPCFGAIYFGAFPYGLLLSADGTRLYVTTAGGCDTVDVLDVDPTSATFNTLIGSFTVPGSSGRPSWRNGVEIVFPLTIYNANFTGSQAGFAVVDPSNPTAAASYPVAPSPGTLGFVSANEAVVLAGDLVLIPIFGGTSPTLIEASVATGAITRTLSMPAALTYATLHGLAVSADGRRAAVTSFVGGDTVFIDLASFTVSGLYDHGTTSTPNDVAFTPDGSRLVATLQDHSRVDVLKDLPGYDLRLLCPTTAAQGSTFTVAVADCETASPFGVFVSTNPGPILVGNEVVQLGLPLFELFSGVGDLVGAAAATFGMPSIPGLSGLVFYTQAVSVDRDGDLRFSNAATLTVL